MKHNLVIAEKPSVAKSISAVLGASQRKDGFFMGNGYIVSWCFGHLVGQAYADAYDEKYKKWEYGHLPIIPDTWKYTIAPDKKKQYKLLAGLMNRKDVDTVINACDAGREGELIFRLVYEQAGCTKPIQRLWISSMEETAIRDGFQNLRDGSLYDNLYSAALCRAKADWLVGINATRLFTVLYGVTLNNGRVLSPTLALLADRETEISTFKKKPYFVSEIECGGFTATAEKAPDRAIAESIRTACDGANAVAIKVEKQEKTTSPPRLFDLTSLQREANRTFGYTAQQTLDYLQALYEKKLTTYPRTDSRYLTADMASGLPTLVFTVASVLPSMKGEIHVEESKVINNAKVSDHHAVIPTLSMPKADLSALPEGEKNILYLVAFRLVCAVGKIHCYEQTTITLKCQDHDFTVKGNIVIENGWKTYEQGLWEMIDKKTNTENETLLPSINQGRIFKGVKCTMRNGFTSPPKRFTEDTLLSAMENAGTEGTEAEVERKGLGTPATRAGIIEKMVKTGFVQRKDKQLIPMAKGQNLIAILPEQIKSPMLTSEWEYQLGQIEKGTLPQSDFMAGIAALTHELVKNNSEPNPKYVSFFAKPEGESIGKCPRCGASVFEGKKGFFCESRDCGFAMWKDNKFFSAKKKKLDAKIAAALITDGHVSLSNLFSEKTGKTYSATIVLEDTGKYVNFKLNFGKGK